MNNDQRGDEWSTPQALVDFLNDEFHFTIDVCATRGNAKVGRFFVPVLESVPLHALPQGSERLYSGAIGLDGLAHPWASEVFWMNPPYSRGSVERWVAKAVTETTAAMNPARGVSLVRADTSADWWRDYVSDFAKEVRFTKRIVFEGAGGAAYPFPTALVVWDRRAGRGGPRYSYVDLPPECLGRSAERRDKRMKETQT